MTSGIATFTLFHVLLSLIGIFAGFVVAGGLAAGKRLDGWTGVFLVTTIATSVTGFGFPFETFLPSHGVAIISLVILPVTIVARYAKQLPERLRLDRAALPQAPGPDGRRTDPERAAIPAHPAARAGAVRLAGSGDREGVPCRGWRNGPRGIRLATASMKVSRPRLTRRNEVESRCRASSCGR